MSETLDWPLPPFFKLAGPSGPAKACAVELIDGLMIIGELVEFDLAVESVAVRVPASEHVERVKFARIRSLKLTVPIAYTADRAALEAVGSDPLPDASERSFVVALRDGTKIRGNTLGFIKKKSGVFLFLIETDRSKATNCFIPEGRIHDLQIGPLLGETLVKRNVVSADTLALAVTKQTKLRQERIGSYLGIFVRFSVDGGPWAIWTVPPVPVRIKLK